MCIRDRDRRGQNAGRHPACLSQCPDGKGRAHRHGQRLSGQARLGMDGEGLSLPRDVYKRQVQERSVWGDDKMATAPELSLRGGRRSTWQSHATGYVFAGSTLLSDRVLRDSHVASLLGMTNLGALCGRRCHPITCKPARRSGSAAACQKSPFGPFSPSCFPNCKINFCIMISQFCRCGGLFDAKGNPDGFLSHYPSLRRCV